MAVFAAAMPNEGSVCYVGEIRDTLDDEQFVRWLVLRGARPAVADSADPNHIWYSKRSGCDAPVIAIGHSHPYAMGALCTHSNQDANLLFNDRRLVVSVVWCLDGRVQTLFQDGRRSDRRWRDP